jgi:hypothetical protein
MTATLVIIALFFVIGIGVGVVAVIAVSILRRDIGPSDDPPGFGPPGPGGPSPDLDWDDPQDGGSGGAEADTRWQSYGRE